MGLPKGVSAVESTLYRGFPRSLSRSDGRCGLWGVQADEIWLRGNKPEFSAFWRNRANARAATVSFLQLSVRFAEEQWLESVWVRPDQ